MTEDKKSSIAEEFGITQARATEIQKELIKVIENNEQWSKVFSWLRRYDVIQVEKDYLYFILGMKIERSESHDVAFDSIMGLAKRVGDALIEKKKTEKKKK